MLSCCTRPNAKGTALTVVNAVPQGMWRFLSKAPAVCYLAAGCRAVGYPAALNCQPAGDPRAGSHAAAAPGCSAVDHEDGPHPKAFDLDPPAAGCSYGRAHSRAVPCDLDRHLAAFPSGQAARLPLRSVLVLPRASH